MHVMGFKSQFDPPNYENNFGELHQKGQDKVVYNALRWIAQLLFKLLSRVEVIGRENVPLQGGIILAVNHLSRIDPPLVFALLERQDATVLAADKYKKNLFFRLAIESVRGIWINRDEADFNALREALHHLQQGGLLGIAPEGTRSRSGALIQAKTGIAYLADKAHVPVLPIAVWGTESAFHQLFRLCRPRITIHFGEPITLPPVERRQREARLQQNTDEIMCHIARMLPPEYRGVYADHPRLKELLADSDSLIGLFRQSEESITDFS
jgi:1-acyl-sn-glycerol-3-phosphate acyltransferase